MNQEFIKAVQKLERVTQMQWDEFDWLDSGHSVFAAYDCDPETSDSLMFGIAGNDSPAWADRLNGCGLDEVATEARQHNAITTDELTVIMDYFGE